MKEEGRGEARVNAQGRSMKSHIVDDSFLASSKFTSTVFWGIKA